MSRERKKVFKVSLIFLHFPVFNRVGDILSSDSLTEIITKMHNDNDLPISIKASLVYRGLPVINTIPKWSASKAYQWFLEALDDPVNLMLNKSLFFCPFFPFLFLYVNIF